MRYKWAGELEFKVKFPADVNEDELALVIENCESLNVGDEVDIQDFIKGVNDIAGQFGGKVKWFCKSC